MELKLSNNAIGTLVSSMTADGTSVVLAPGQGAKFPAINAGEWFPITVVRASEPTQFEIMHVTARSGDVLTVTRAHEGTVAITFSVGDVIEHRLTKDALDRDFVRLGPDSLESVRFSVAADGDDLKATVHADGKELEFGTAAARDVGTGANEVPTNALVIEATIPIGFVYTQYPGEASPSDLFGGTWTLLFNTEGVFFRTEGEGASGFGSGVQGDAIRNITGYFNQRVYSNQEYLVGHARGGVFSASREEVAASVPNPNGTERERARLTFDASKVVPTASENRPRNLTIRVWKKTAH